MFKEVYTAIAANDPSNPNYPTFRDGLRELVLCERIIESNKKQAWVKV
jgi:predicted dehydrogenase